MHHRSWTWSRSTRVNWSKMSVSYSETFKNFGVLNLFSHHIFVDFIRHHILSFFITSSFRYFLLFYHILGAYLGCLQLISLSRRYYLKVWFPWGSTFAWIHPQLELTSLFLAIKNPIGTSIHWRVLKALLAEECVFVLLVSRDTWLLFRSKSVRFVILSLSSLRCFLLCVIFASPKIHYH